MPIKTFRGKIAHDTVDTIVLHTRSGTTGYKINKLQTFPEQPTSTDTEALLKIFSIPQTTTSAEVDFSDNTLLAMAYFSGSSSSQQYAEDMTVVFDNMVFNQDIYVTHTDNEGSASVNYYIELEQIKLDLNENTVATLKDIRNLS